MICICLVQELTFAQKTLKKADTYYVNNHFSEAIPLYEEALQEKENIIIRARLANCYFRLNQLEQASVHYEQVVHSEKAKPAFWYEYGIVLLGQGKYDEARTWFERYVAKQPDEARGKRMLAACDKMNDLNPFFDNISIERFVGNSDADDNAPILLNDRLIFCSDRLRRDINIFKERSGMTGRDFLYLYESKQETDGSYTTAELFSNKINALNKNTGPATFDENGTRIVYSRNGDRPSNRNAFNMQLFEATLEKGKWKSEKLLSFCSKEYNYMHPSLSPSGDTLFFVSDKPKGKGGTDIYVSYRKANGKDWTTPQNLGESINTPESEGFPFVATNGWLFFCSRGHTGFGGFDVFVSKLDTMMGEWQVPTNLGKPVNSASDDMGICFQKDMTSGAFASSRGRNDDDIYFFNTKLDDFANRKNTPLPQEETVVKTTTQTPTETKEPSIFIFKPKMTELDLEASKPDSVVVSTDEQPTQEQVTLPQDEIHHLNPTSNSFKGYKINDLAIRLKVEKMAVGKRFVLNIKFDEDESKNLSPQTVIELNKLVEVMQKNPNLALEVACHTSSLGDDSYNLKRSKERADVIVAYLVEADIAPERLEAKGYGESEILNQCKNGIVCTPTQHKENERVEIKILKL